MKRVAGRVAASKQEKPQGQKAALSYSILGLHHDGIEMGHRLLGLPTEFGGEGGDLAACLVERAGAIDFFGGEAEFFGDGELRGDALASFCFGKAASMEALDLLLGAAPSDYETIQFWKVTGFDQEGRLDEGDVASAAAGPFVQLLLNGFFDAWVNNSVQASELFIVRKSYGSELGAIDAAPETENFRTELTQDFVVGGLTTLEESVREGIGVEDREAHLAKHGGDGAFAAGYSAGQTHAEHACVSGHWRCGAWLVTWRGGDERLSRYCS